MSVEVTVGICAYNEDKNIGILLDNILTEQALPTKSEILVVCSGCTDNTIETVNSFAKQNSQIHIYIEAKRRGKASAINYILKNAKGNAIIFISADTLPTKNCFSKLLTKLQLPNVGIVCGKPTPINDSKLLVGRMVHLLWNLHDHIFHELNDAGLARHASEIYCIHKNIIKEIPNQVVNDDAYIALQTKKRGWLIKYERYAHVLICGPRTLMEYFQQRYRIIYGHYQVKKLTGQSPQHPLHLLPVFPLRVIYLSLQFSKTQDVPTLAAFILIELTASFTALVQSLLKKPNSQWQQISSTKTIAFIQKSNSTANKKSVS